MERSGSAGADPWSPVSEQSLEDLEEKRKIDREASFQEMEKVFEPIRKFDRSFAGEEPEREKRFKFTESDYNVHRKREFPHIHRPLKSMHKKKKKKDGHKSRRKKKRHDLKFRPVLPGVEEGSEPSSSSFESDTSFDDEFDGSTDERDPPSEFHVSSNGAALKAGDQRVSPLRDIEGGGDVVSPLLGQGSARATDRRDSCVRFADEKTKDSHKDIDQSTPSRRASKSKEGDDQKRMTFLNRLFSDHAMDSPKSSDSLKSANNDGDDVAAQMFTMQADDVPEISKMFESTEDEEFPLVSTLNKDPLYDERGVADELIDSEKVMFRLGADDDEHSEHDADDEDATVKSCAQEPSAELSRDTAAAVFQVESTDSEGKKKRKKEKKKSKHRKHKPRSEHFNLSDLEQRRRAGSEIFDPQLKRVPTEPNEAALLALADLDNMKSHRFEDVRGHRRHKRLGSLSMLAKQDRKASYTRKMSYSSTKKWNHSPHEVFVELDILKETNHHEHEWTEKARWIKFEEDVEEGSERWGKPHVAYLSFHSLLDLRKCIESGSILLDLEAYGLNNIFHTMVEQLVYSDQIDHENQGNILRVLLLKHRHNCEKAGRSYSTSSMRNAFASSHSLRGDVAKVPSSTPRDMDLLGKEEATRVDIDNNTSLLAAGAGRPRGSSCREDGAGAVGSAVALHDAGVGPRRMFGGNAHSDILKKIPVGAETAMVLVGSLEFLKRPVAAFVRLAEAQILDNMAEVPIPVRFIFLLLCPEDEALDDAMDFLEIGRSISTLLSDKVFRETCYRADRRQDILQAINQFLDDSVVLPPGDWGNQPLMSAANLRRKSDVRHRKIQHLNAELCKETDALIKSDQKLDGVEFRPARADPLSRTGRAFGGLVDDVKFRYPLYLSDVKDALNFQCLATIIFIYFAALSPAITFGGLMSEKTNGYVGVSETLLGTSLCGILFALLSGQPLLIIGATGPLLIFEESMFLLCKSAEIDYLGLRFWIGLWVALITLVVVAFDGSALVRYITQFTEEVFASLISVMFIFEVLKKLYMTFIDHPLIPAGGYLPANVTDPLYVDGADMNGTNMTSAELAADNPQPNTALLTVIMCFGTFMIAEQLKAFRNGQFLGRSARRAIGDFGIPLAILIMTVIDVVFGGYVYVQKLNVPDGLSPTNAQLRDWIVDPTADIKVWVPFVAIIPAFLVFILIFMESQITAIIVNKKERNLRKGSGYHLDMLLLGGLCIFSGLLGFPFLSGATIRSVSHTSALSIYSRTHAPGEKPKLLEVKEQRVTGLFVHVLVGLSIFMGALLRQIPMAVLFGVFFYMGISALSGIQFVQRVKLFFMPVKHHPDENYVKRLRTWRMNLYTSIQTFCFGVLWAVQLTPAALAFPFILILLIPTRLFILPRIFDKQEMAALDAAPTTSAASDKLKEPTEPDTNLDEPDFYEQSHIKS